MEGEREGEKHCTCPDLGLNPPHRHVPWPEIEPVTSCFVDDTQPTEPCWSQPKWITLQKYQGYQKQGKDEKLSHLRGT